MNEVNDVRSALKLVILTFPFWVFFRSIFLLKIKSKFTWPKEILYSVSFMYSVAVISITLLDFKLGTGFAEAKAYSSEYMMRTVNLVPFKDTADMFQIALAKEDFFFIRWALLNVVGNGVLLMPLGFLLPILNPRYESFKKILAAGFIVTCSIEFLQFAGTYLNVFVRTVDIDDILLNTLGSVLGYFIYLLCRKVLIKLGFKISTLGIEKARD